MATRLIVYMLNHNTFIKMENNIFYTYGRKPTASEIKFGHGAWHYKDFDPYLCFKKNGDLKKRLKCPVDGLIYTR